MALTILMINRNVKVPFIVKLKLKSRMVKMLPDQTMEVLLFLQCQPPSCSQLVSRVASDNAPARTRHGLATQNYCTSQVQVLVVLIAVEFIQVC